jgi:predicted nucleotidyltransferase
MMANLSVPRKQIQIFCQRHHIRRMSFFGSVLRDDFGPESDIDVLVEFEEGARVTLFDMVDMQDELAALLGRHIDLATPDGLNRHLQADVLAHAQVIYDRAA